MLRPDETLDPLGVTNLQLVQPKKGFRFSLDPFLLCGFSGFHGEQTIYDLGCGNGVIPLLAAGWSSASRVVGIERQPQMVERARRSVDLNGMKGRVTILEGDLREIRQLCSGQEAELVLANPPFRVPGNGRISTHDERAAARHELAGGLADFLQAAHYLLGKGGRCCLVFLPERLPELLMLMQKFHLEPKRLRLVHHRVGEEARLVLVEGFKNGRAGLAVGPPLILYVAEQELSREVAAWYGLDGGH